MCMRFSLRCKTTRLWFVCLLAALLKTLIFCLPCGAEAQPKPPQSPSMQAWVWVSYLEWQPTDFATAEAFTARARQMANRCAALGAAGIILQVRPFGDALYPSRLFPFSHLCTGVQGQSPGFDPLAIFLAQAHHQGLKLWAWVNPYRLAASDALPGVLAAENLANTHPGWVCHARGGVYLRPACPAAQQYIADGVAELCAKYPLDGIQFDDYFYPTTDLSFDADDYAAYQASGGRLPLDAWRMANVNSLLALCYRTVHAYDTPTAKLCFSVSPQGGLAGCRAQACDTTLWLCTPGYLDCLMPQLYHGLQYTKNGSDEAALSARAAQWLALPRDDAVSLWFGLGAFRIGAGDGGDAGPEWQSGGALAAQAAWLAARGCNGVGLYRYASLFENGQYSGLAGQETAALQDLLMQPQPRQG